MKKESLFVLASFCVIILTFIFRPDGSRFLPAILVCILSFIIGWKGNTILETKSYICGGGMNRGFSGGGELFRYIIDAVFHLVYVFFSITFVFTIFVPYLENTAFSEFYGVLFASSAFCGGAAALLPQRAEMMHLDLESESAELYAARFIKYIVSFFIWCLILVCIVGLFGTGNF